jgi:hypothetical protein
VNRILVQIAEMPGVLRDLVASAVAAQPDMEIVGAIGARAAGPPLPGRAADVVIVAVPSIADGAALRDHPFAHPDQRVLALATDGRRAVVYELRPHLTDLGEISPDGLVAAIRSGRPAHSN